MNKPIISGNTITIPSDLEYINDVDIFLEGVLRGYEIDESVIADIAISVSELVINAINHGNKSLQNKLVAITINRNEKNVSISISDQGFGFDPKGIANPLADENLMKDTGRGIFIVKSLMDNVDIQVTDTGTLITITKKIK